MERSNLNKLDRQIRLIAGMALIMFAGIKASILIALLGFMVLITGMYGFCPVYKLLKIDNYNRTKNKPEDKDRLN